MAMAPSEADWAGLPEHLLDLIYDKFDLLSDHIRFSAVCYSWHRRTLPLLMIPTKDSNKKKRSLYSLTDQKVFNFQLQVPYNRRCCGSSYGWLVVFKKTVAPILFNPFRNKTLHLPRLEIGDKRYRRDYEIIKVVLSADPDYEEHYVVALIYTVYCRLAFMKAGDESWTYMDLYTLYDVIFYRGKILAVTNRRRVVSVDIFSNQVKILSPSIEQFYIGRVYLVESFTGDLLMVQRLYYDVDGMSGPEEYEKYQCMTETFEVYKLVLDDQTGMVVDKIEVKSLGEETLFLGDSSSMSVLASMYHGLNQNSIYYTDDTAQYCNHGPRDVGMFSLKDRSVHQHYLLNPSQKHMPPSIWIVPTLQGIRI